MLFNSYIFIFAFLPVCLGLFYLLKAKQPTLAKVWLIAMSLVFYGYFNVSYLLIMLFSIAFNYLIHRMLSRATDRNKAILITGVTVNLLVLFCFKYFDFFIENCNRAFSMDIPLKNILLPLGISFFTFQQIGFIADTYRGEVKDCNLVDYMLFVSFFPQLIAGPIVNHDEMLPQFKRIGEKIPSKKLAKGAYVFVIGMSKKVLVADTFGKAVDYAYLHLGSGINSTESLLAILFYTLQLYFDFSGYCDMAIGLGLMLGIDIPLNFNSPYKAVNIIDFWKRWHITLNRFFTKNIYIPLGGNRKGEVRMYTNLFIVFFLSGLWHGAGWNYVLWGCMHGVLYIITRAWQKRKPDYKATGIVKVICIAFTFIFVNIAWVYFRAANVAEANQMITNVFSASFTRPGIEFAECFNLPEFWYVLKVLHMTDFAFSRYIVMTLFSVCALIMTFFTDNVHEMAGKSRYNALTGLMLGILFVWCVVSLSGVSTFLYFNF